MSNPITIPSYDTKLYSPSYSCPSNFIFYNKNEKKRYSKILNSMKKLGIKTSSFTSFNNINIDRIIPVILKSPQIIEEYDSPLFASLTNNDEKNINNDNQSSSQKLIEYMSTYITDSDSDNNTDNETDSDNKNIETINSNIDETFVMDDLCYSDSDEEENFTKETFMNIAKYLLEQDNKNV